MAMKGRTIRRHFRESLKSLNRNGWMTFASISAVTVTLLLVGVFTVIMMNLNKLADDIENDVEIRVLIEIIEDPTEAKAAEEKLMKEIKSLPDVEEVVYSSKEQELNNLIEDFGDDLSLLNKATLYGTFFMLKQQILNKLRLSRKNREIR